MILATARCGRPVRPAALAVLLAGAGHRVCGLDAAAGMLAVARRKAAAHGVAVPLVRGDASRPPFAPGSFADERYLLLSSSP